MSIVAKKFRIDSDLNNQATALLEGFGLSMSQAVSEAERLEADPNTKRYTDMNEMWAYLDKYDIQFRLVFEITDLCDSVAQIANYLATLTLFIFPEAWLRKK